VDLKRWMTCLRCRSRLGIPVCLGGEKRSLISFWEIGTNTLKRISHRTWQFFRVERRGKRTFCNVFLISYGVLVRYVTSQAPANEARRKRVKIVQLLDEFQNNSAYIYDKALGKNQADERDIYVCLRTAGSTGDRFRE